MNLLALFSTFWRSTKFAIALRLLVIGLAFGAASCCEAAPDYQGEFRMGMEIELQESLLQKIVHLFDWEAVRRDSRTDERVIKLLGGKALPDLLSKMPPEYLAHLAIELANVAYFKLPNYPPARTDLSPADAQILKGLKWHKDNGKMEFSHEEPFSNPADYLRSLRLFSKTVGIDGRLDNPLDRRRHELSYHVHLSDSQGNSVAEVLAHYNRLMLTRLAGKGNAAELFSEDRISRYSELLDERGLVRLLENNHFELRRHVLPPEKELEELIRLFSLPKDEAIKEIAEETQSLLTPKTLRYLVELSPADAISIITLSAEPIPLAKVRLSLQDPGFAKLVLASLFSKQHLAHDIDAFLFRLEHAKSNGVPGASGLLRRFSNRFQDSLNKERLPGLAKDLNTDTFLAFIEATSQTATPKKVKYDISNPDIGKIILRSKNEPVYFVSYTNRLSRYCNVNSVVAEGILKLFTQRPNDQHLELLSGLPPEFLVTSVGWQVMERALGSQDPRLRLKALNKVQMIPLLFSHSQNLRVRQLLQNDPNVEITEQLAKSSPLEPNDNGFSAPLPKKKASRRQVNCSDTLLEFRKLIPESPLGPHLRN